MQTLRVLCACFGPLVVKKEARIISNSSCTTLYQNKEKPANYTAHSGVNPYGSMMIVINRFNNSNTFEPCLKPRYRYSFLLLFFALLSAPVVAQTTQPCIDSNRINPWYICGSTSDYSPVCGCDGKTYVNNCASYNRAGVNLVQYNGVCSNDIYHFDFWPNPVGDRIQFYMQFAADKGSQAIVQIFDSYGNLTYYKLLNNVPDEFPYVETIYFGGLRTGVYTLVINAGGVYKYQRFIKYSY